MRSIVKALAITLAALNVLLTGCEDTSFQKVPTEVNVVFGVSTNTASNPSFTGGYIALSSFEFEGRRTAGDDVAFEKEFEPQLKVAFDTTVIMSELMFDIPQGEYYRIDVRFDTEDADWSPNVLATGTYNSTSNGTIPIRFELASSEHFDIRATGNRITLTKDVAKNAVVLLDPNTWFDIVPTSMFENADRIVVDGILTILINEQENVDIFELVVNRMEESCTVEFKDN